MDDIIQVRVLQLLSGVDAMYLF